MANEEEQQAGTEMYRFTGMKNQWDDTDRLILEGSSTNPVRYVDRGGEIELTEEDAERAKQAGARLNKLSDEQVQRLEEKREQQGEGPPQRGSTQAPGRPAGQEGRGGAQTKAETGTASKSGES